MSRTSRNFVVAYIFLVGLPLLGLVGVLRSGRSLKAPISVDGIWKIEANTKALASYSCASASTLLNSPLLISQSGRNLEISLKGQAQASGALDDKTLKASLPIAGDTSCGNGPVTLSALVDTSSDPRWMSGQLSFSGCLSCTPIDFRAVRQPKSQGGGSH